MAFEYHRLSAVTWVGCKAATPAVFTNASGVTSFIRQIWLHAPHDGLLSYSRTSIKVFMTPASQSAQVTNQLFTRSLLTNETYVIDCGVPGLIFKNQSEYLRMWHRAGTTIVFCLFGGKE